MANKSLGVLALLASFLIGWLASDVFRSQKSYPTKTVEYKVIMEPTLLTIGGGQEFQKILITHAKEGWKLVPWHPSPYIVLER